MSSALDNLPWSVPVYAVVLLISFLAYSPQTSPILGHVTRSQSIKFNLLLTALWASYINSIRTPAGSPPREWIPPENGWGGGKEWRANDNEDGMYWASGGERWCKKCEAWKPRRTHHCRKCGVCILKMDHHCRFSPMPVPREQVLTDTGPWTANCVGHANSAHFFRFLSYCCLSMTYLWRLLFPFLYEVYSSRNDTVEAMGLSIYNLLHLFFLLPILAITHLALAILWVRYLFNVTTNTTTIESWEIEKYESQHRRKRKQAGILLPARVFPYDIGIWENLVEALGPSWWAWWWPFAAGGPPVYDGRKNWDWEEQGGGGIRWRVNGFDDPSLEWPPKDEDEIKPVERIVSLPEKWVGDDILDKRAFEERRRRWGGVSASTPTPATTAVAAVARSSGMGWKNSEGERLADYGVDEDADAPTREGDDDDEDVPLGELLRRRKAREGNGRGD